MRTATRTVIIVVLGATLAHTVAAAATPPAEPLEPRLVLRVDTQHFAFPFDYFEVETPLFSAYADGTVIEPGLEGLRATTLDPHQLQALLDFALDEGGLRDAAESYSDQELFDGTVTSFTVFAEGVDRRISVYGLGAPVEHMGELDESSRVAYEGLLRLREHLVWTDDWLPPGAESRTIEPQAYRARLVITTSGATEPWPWPEITSADLVETHGRNGPILGVLAVDLTPEQVSRVTGVPTSGLAGAWINGPDGHPYRLTISPLLPDQGSLGE